jgi:dTDP-4-amino-4,6-dideoxygalactose transaminase
MSRLAIHGGTPVRARPFAENVTIGEEEKRAVAEVLDGTVLSKFLGVWHPDFYGGPRVQKVEREWEAYFGVRHAVTVNSATSGLNAAIGAAGVGPGDEVIVSPYTMSASAACALVYNAIPVFADIDPDTFCITTKTIGERLSPRTRAIVVVDLFGQPADMDPILELARRHNLLVIEDAAQAPGARYRGRYAGTLADVGVFSLNYHKAIHCGEGGVVVTNDDNLAERVRLIRNHAEAVVKNKGIRNLVNMLGFNYRMTEIEAAIASEQLKKLERLVLPRIELANLLTEGLSALPGLKPPLVPPDVRHGYYVYAIRYDEKVTGVPRARYAAALRAEGLPVAEGYVEPLYLQPLYQERTVYGSGGCPFTCSEAGRAATYHRGLCPIAERMYAQELMLTTVCHANSTRADIEDVRAAFHKVHDHLGDLADGTERAAA